MPGMGSRKSHVELSQTSILVCICSRSYVLRFMHIEDGNIFFSFHCNVHNLIEGLQSIHLDLLASLCVDILVFQWECFGGFEGFCKGVLKVFSIF